MNIEKYIELAKQISTTVNRKRAHVSFIVKKNKIISIGTNAWKTHPKAVEYGYMLPYLHSELDAFRKLKHQEKNLTLINFRLTKTEVLGMSKPCIYCMPWCSTVFDKIIYSDENGKIRVLK